MDEKLVAGCPYVKHVYELHVEHTLTLRSDI